VLQLMDPGASSLAFCGNFCDTSTRNRL